MLTIDMSVLLHVPTDLVYRYLEHPQHLAAYDLTIIPNDTYFTWSYGQWEGTGELTKAQLDHQLDLRFWGDFAGSLTYYLHAIHACTKLSVVLDGEVPNVNYPVIVAELDGKLNGLKCLLENCFATEKSWLTNRLLAWADNAKSPPVREGFLN